jgi:hypothetical protein
LGAAVAVHDARIPHDQIASFAFYETSFAGIDALVTMENHKITIVTSTSNQLVVLLV